MRWLDGIPGSMDMSLSKLPCPSQGSLACCSPWGRKGSDMTERLNWTELSLLRSQSFLAYLFHSKNHPNCFHYQFRMEAQTQMATGHTLYVYVYFVGMYSLHVCVLSCFSCVRLFVTLWTVAHQAPLSMGFSQGRILEWDAIILQGIFPT